MKEKSFPFGSRSVIVAFVLVLAFAGLAVLPGSQAASPATFHVTLGASSPDMALMGMAFYPNALTIHRGDIIVFTNNLIEPHTVTLGLTGPVTDPLAFFAPINSAPGSVVFTNTGLVSSGFLLPDGPFGNSYAVTFDVAPGTYVAQCALHPLMSSTITVVPDAQALPKTDAQYQATGHAHMVVDIAHARTIAVASALAAAKASDLGGVGIEVAVGGGDGVSTVMRFSSSNLTVHMGDTVTFVNRDPFTPHTVTFGQEPPGGDAGLVAPFHRAFDPQLQWGVPTPYDGTFDLSSGFLLAIFPWGNTFAVTFTAAGTYHYICGLHDQMGMTGTINVVA